MTDLWNALYSGAISSIETTISSYLQRNRWTDAITNYLSPGHLFTATRELIGCRQSNGTVWFDYSRDYNPASGEKPLNNVSELKFDPTTGYLVGVGPVIKGRLQGVERGGRNIFNQDFSLLGGLRSITGGILPGRLGDVDGDLQDYIESDEQIVREATGAAFDYYRKKAVPIGTQSGREWFVARIPGDMQTPFQLFDFSRYDPGLCNKFMGIGMAYHLIEPLFGLAKNVMMGINRRQTATSGEGKPSKKGLVLDPIIAIQTYAARKIQEAGGGMIAPFYPLLVLANPFLETLHQEIFTPIYSVVDDIFGAADGLFNPFPPEQAKARTYFSMPPEYALTDGGIYTPALSAASGIRRRSGLRLLDGLTDAGPVDDERTIRGIDFREAQARRKAA